MRFILIFASFILGFCSIYADNSVDFLVLPDSIKSGPNKPVSIQSSSLPTLAGSLLGLNSKPVPGFTQDLFSRPEAVVVVQVESANKLKIAPSANSIKIVTDKLPEYADLFFDLTTSFSDGGVTVVDTSEEISGTYSSEIVPDSSNNNEVEEDLLIEKELNSARGLLKWINKNAATLVNSKPDVFVLHFNGLDEPANNEIATHKSAIETFIAELSEVMKSVYGNNAAVLLVQLDPVVHSRQPRQSVGADGAPSKSLKKFSARWYDPNYPVAFNIILWLMVAFWLTILGVSVFIWFMDPGSDSIIYRMTMSKGKRD